jgi:hypothetical protein
MTKVGRQAIDNLCSPALTLLPLHDVSTDLPVQQDEFAVYGGCRPNLRCLNAAFQFGQKAIVVRREDAIRHCRALARSRELSLPNRSLTAREA